jgi:tetratricopeptide (TPR) repeat protein
LSDQNTQTQKEYQYEKAIPFALKAHELKRNLTPATNSLAICYSVLGEKELANKYFKISVSNGVNAEGLSRTIKNIAESEIDL